MHPIVKWTFGDIGGISEYQLYVDSFGAPPSVELAGSPLGAVLRRGFRLPILFWDMHKRARRHRRHAA